ncbi:Mu-like prophage major head subunit gpT family protein [Megalodesulfovibrio paquesii]
MLINRQNLSALTTGFKVIFNNAFAGAPSDYEKIAMTVPSSTAQEVYPWLGNLTSFRKWVGDRVVQNFKEHKMTIVNEPFENTIGVKRTEIEDDQYGVYNPLFQQLGYDAKTHPDELVWGLLKQGFETPCYDGQYFFDTDHPVIRKDGSVASASNYGGGSGTPWYLFDLRRPIKPIIFQKRKDYTFVSLTKEDDENVFMRGEYLYGVDARVNVGFGLWQVAYASRQPLTAENYAAGRAAMQNLQGDMEKPLGLAPNLLVVPPSLEGDAREVLLNERTAAGATNTWRNTAELMVTPWLA